MLDSAKFNTKFKNKVGSVQADVLAIAKLVTSNPSLVTEDVVKELTLVEGIVSSLQEFTFAIMAKNENSAVDVEPSDVSTDTPTPAPEPAPAADVTA